MFKILVAEDDGGAARLMLDTLADALSGKLRLCWDVPRAAPGVWSASPLPAGVQVVPPCYLGPNVRVGEGSLLGPHAVLEEVLSRAEAHGGVAALAADPPVHGILVQLPLPRHIDPAAVIAAIPPEKDVDGFHPVNVGLLSIGDDCYAPATPSGIIAMFKEYGIEIAGKHCVIIGRSNIVGKPMALLLLKANGTVSVCHSKTADLASHTKQADILVVAIGRAKFITADMVADGAVIVDVGMNRVDGKLCGDVDFEPCAQKASYITPVPGGVGPMTIAMLMENTFRAWENAQR